MTLKKVKEEIDKTIEKAKIEDDDIETILKIRKINAQKKSKKGKK